MKNMLIFKKGEKMNEETEENNEKTVDFYEKILYDFLRTALTGGNDE